MRRPTARGERGSVSALVVVLAVALMIVAGLVVDGGNAINARQRVIDDAEQAARVGANQIDEITLRTTGDVVILESAAAEAATSFVLARGYDLNEVVVTASADEVSVALTDTVSTQLLSLVGIGSFTVDGEATARPAVGIVEEIQ